MKGQLSLEMMMHGLLIPVRQDPAALKWGLSVLRSRFNPADTFPVHGYRIDYTNQRVILHTWSPQYQSPLLDPKDVDDMLDNRIG